MPHTPDPRSSPQARPAPTPPAAPELPVLGLLMLDTRFPRPPGDIGHPSSLAGTVLREVVAGADAARVVRGSDIALLKPFVAAGQRLVNDGAQAIGTSCGFLARWQRPLQAALPVPVWTSALLLIAEHPRTRFGVITIEAKSLSAEHFTAVGADPETPVEGITPGSALHRTLLEDRPTLDERDAEAQVVAAGKRLLARHPRLDALLLECTNLPPYAPALRAACGKPVHHVLSMLEGRRLLLARQGALQANQR